MQIKTTIWWGGRRCLSLTHWLVGMKISVATVNIIMAALQKSKNRNTIGYSYTTPGYKPKGIKLSIQKRYLLTHVYCSTIHNSQVMGSV
jgi:hypothetical protein